MASTQVLQIPIEITIRIGEITVGGSPAVTANVEVDQGTASGAGEAEERMWLDDDYSARPGYDPNFLGGDPVELPTLTEEAMQQASCDQTTDREDSHILPYHHFSLVMNKQRRMLFYAALNTTRNPDQLGTWSRRELSGGSDRWILDPRIPAAHQVVTRELYTPLHFDRGHVVKRDDAYWGTTEEEAQFGNFDSFHYTNCTPQHPSFNRSNKGEGLWGRLENQVASQANVQDLRLNVFAGPVLEESDPEANGIQIPRALLEVIVARRDKTGELGAWGFMLSQEGLVRENLEAEEGFFDPGDFEMYMVSLDRIEKLTSLRFPENVRKADRKVGEESLGDDVVPITSLNDLEL